MRFSSRPVSARNHAVALLVLIAALLVVGVVAQEIVRHVLQALPALVCLCAAIANVRAVKWAAYAIYALWSAIALLIWLFLLGVSHLASGHYTMIEIAMTVAFVLAGAYGVTSGWRRPGGVGALGAIALFVLALALQILVMAVSFKAPWAHDAQVCAAYAVPLLCSR